MCQSCGAVLLCQKARNCGLFLHFCTIAPSDPLLEYRSDRRKWLQTFARLLFDRCTFARLVRTNRGNRAKVLRRIFVMFPSREGNKGKLIVVKNGARALSPTLPPVIGRQGNRPLDRPKRLSRRQGRTWAFVGQTKTTPRQASARCRWVKGCCLYLLV